MKGLADDTTLPLRRPGRRPGGLHRADHPRYYEEIGLLPLAPRKEDGRRHYGDEAVRRLTFIRRCRDFGFSIEHVRELVDLTDLRPCVQVRDIAAARLGEVRDKLAELLALESSLSKFVDGCESACAGGAVVDRTVLDDLAQPIAPQTPACCSKRKESVQ
jgi:DNA-binding transcriptional MerR regulator